MSSQSNFPPPTFVAGFHDTSVVESGKLRYSRLGNTHMIVSNLGLGCGTFSQHYGDVPVATAHEMVMTALKSGVNFLDTAPWYGDSEIILGEVLKRVPRESFYLSTKAGRYSKEPSEKTFDFSRAEVTRSIERSLQRLNVTYLDQVIIHDVEFCVDLRQIVEHTIPALLCLKEEGKLRCIGISGYNLGVLRRLVQMAPKGSIDVVLSYSRYTLFNKDLEYHLDYFRQRGVGIINAAPIGMGLLAGEWASWHPALDSTKSACKYAAEECKKRGFSLANLAVQWSLHRDEIPVALIGHRTVSEFETNLSLASTAPNEDLVRRIEREFFAGLAVSHWENEEVERRYWNSMRENGWKQKSDL